MSMTNRVANFGAALLLAGAAASFALSGPNPADAQTALLPSFSGLVERARPAVVTVKTQMDETNAQIVGGEEMDPQLRDFFDRFFGEKGPFGDQERPPEEHHEHPMGLGSGFIIDPSGVIVTNNHVVDHADEVTVVLDDGTEMKAKVVGTDEKTDIAVLRVHAASNLPTVQWGDSEGVKVGDWAIAIGNPFGLGGSVSAGIISARGRNINSGPYDDYFQIDAPINRGNSGGPLFDQLGHVIGVNTAIFSPNGGSVGIGFAIPSNQARAIVAELLRSGHVERGWLGVSIQKVTPQIAQSLGLSRAEGALIAKVNDGSPAARGGLEIGDVIVDFDGTHINDVRDLTRAVAGAEPGSRTTVRVLRRGSERTLTVTPGHYPA